MIEATGRTRRIRPGGPHLGVILTLGLTLGACSEGAREPSAPRLPARIPAAIHDARIGRGVPEQFRLAGTEHNRLSLFTLRRLQPDARTFVDPMVRCVAIQRVLFSQAPNTAKAAGIPTYAGELIRLARATMRTLPGCQTGPASMSALATVPAAAEVSDEYVEISPAAFAVLDQLEADVNAANSVAAVDAAAQRASASAATFDELDATAVFAAVAQTQASAVLWAPEGAGWAEVDPSPDEQSLFGRRTVRSLGDMDKFIGAVSGDVAGCVGTLRFMRQLPIAWPHQILIAACGFSAAGASVYTAYKLYEHY